MALSRSIHKPYCLKNGSDHPSQVHTSCKASLVTSSELDKCLPDTLIVKIVSYVLRLNGLWGDLNDVWAGPDSLIAVQG